jgi:hypothetical protein
MVGLVESGRQLLAAHSLGIIAVISVQGAAYLAAGLVMTARLRSGPAGTGSSAQWQRAEDNKAAR